MSSNAPLYQTYASDSPKLMSFFSGAFITYFIAIVTFLILLSVGIMIYQRLKKCSPVYDKLLHYSANVLNIDTYLQDKDLYSGDLITCADIKVEFPSPNTPSSVASPFNYKTQKIDRLSKFFEISNTRSNNQLDYIAISREKFEPLTRTRYYALSHDSMMYVTKVRRFDDEQTFYYILFNGKFINYTASTSYKAVYAMIDVVLRLYPESEYIFSGNFNVHGHEAVFKELLPKYLICDFKCVPTCYDGKTGLASPDGIAVSPKLYKRIEYGVVFNNLDTSKHMMVYANMYRKHQKRGGAFVDCDMPLTKYINKVAVPTCPQDKSFYNKPSKFNAATDSEKYKPDELKPIDL